MPKPCLPVFLFSLQSRLGAIVCPLLYSQLDSIVNIVGINSKNSKRASALLQSSGRLNLDFSPNICALAAVAGLRRRLGLGRAPSRLMLACSIRRRPSIAPLAGMDRRGQERGERRAKVNRTNSQKTDEVRKSQ